MAGTLLRISANSWENCVNHRQQSCRSRLYFSRKKAANFTNGLQQDANFLVFSQLPHDAVSTAASIMKDENNNLVDSVNSSYSRGPELES